MLEKSSVLLPDGESPFAVSVARCLSSIPGITAHALSNTSNCALRYSRACQSFRVMERSEATLSLSAISRALALTGATVLLPVDTTAIRFVSANHERLKEMAAIAPVPALESLELVENKWVLVGFLGHHAIAHPDTLLASDDDQFARSLSAFPFPVLLKPATGSNGRGIHGFADRNSLLGFLRSDREPQRQCIVQAYVPGEDIDCSVLCHHGEILAYTIQNGFIPGPRQFAPAGGITFLEDDQVLSTVAELMGRLRWNGVAHVDLRYDSRGGKPVVIEVNPRFWGSLLGSLAAGVNFPELSCCAALGKPFSRPLGRQTRFVSAGTAVRQWLRPPWRDRAASFSFRETSVRHVITDPGPESFDAIKASWGVMRKLSRRPSR